MNRVVVGQAAAGLATYLLDNGLAGGKVIIGHDARHKSDVFARDSAEIFAGAGFQALLVPVPTPTPVVAYGIGHFGCVAGVVVTASHNPPQDNGYKVYLGDGSQIVPPADAEIAARIEDVTRHDLADVPRSDAYTEIGDELVEAYLNRVVSLVPTDAPRALDWVYTPMHGVGGKIVAEAVRRAGFNGAEVVSPAGRARPRLPDRRLPEPGGAGRDRPRSGAGRADRTPTWWWPTTRTPTGARSRRRSTARGGCCVATSSARCSATTPCVGGSQGTYACSVVSSSLLAAMAAAHEQPFATTLTGFKWIGRVPGLAYGYEEAIGYCVDPASRPRQGRHLGADPGAHPGRGVEGGGPDDR